MATYQIEGDSIKVIGGVKVGFNVTLAAGNKSKSFYHEVESIDPTVINNELAKLALEFEAQPDSGMQSIALNVDEPVEAVVVPVEAPVV